MKILLVIIALLIAAYTIYQYSRISRLVATSAILVAEAKAYTQTGGTRALLVLGDSTAVGVGAPSETTVAARLAKAGGLSVENHAVSGARTSDMQEQFALHSREKYDLVLIQIGANDVIRFSPLQKLRDDISNVLKDARSVSDRVVLLTAGKVGSAPFFPQAFGWLWTNRADTVREHFMAAADKYEVVYIDLFTAADPFSTDPKRYYASDGLHLTGEGYGFWYNETQKAIEARWPGFLYER